MSSSDKLIVFAATCLTVCLCSALLFYKLVKPIVKTETKIETAECQVIYAKAKACIEMEMDKPDRFKYNP